MRKFFLLLACVFVLTVLMGVVAPGQGVASVKQEGAAVLRGFDLDAGACNCEEARAELVVLRDRIATAPGLDESRSLALEQTGLARKALSRAKWIIPFNGALGKASDKLDDYEARVQEAGTPEEVAEAFGELVRLASADDLKVTDVDLFDKDGCDYTTGEIIVIVIGLVLGIIPGLIFMLIFC